MPRADHQHSFCQRHGLLQQGATLGLGCRTVNSLFKLPANPHLLHGGDEVFEFHGTHAPEHLKSPSQGNRRLCFLRPPQLGKARDFQQITLCTTRRTGDLTPLQQGLHVLQGLQPELSCAIEITQADQTIHPEFFDARQGEQRGFAPIA